MIDDPLIRHLYVHVPFCAKKCAYCAFYSEASDGDVVNRYVGALIREMELVAAELRPRTIFFGGGTPSLLNLSTIGTHFPGDGTPQPAGRGGMDGGMQSGHRLARQGAIAARLGRQSRFDGCAVV